MKVITTNLGPRKTIIWNNKPETTGIYKKPVAEGIFLGQHDVDNDIVVDRKYHGGDSKACYMYGADWYPYWQELYPDLDWHEGMFGENLTVEGLDETLLNIGAQYQVGDAIVQVTQPRQPCYKLGYRFGDQGLLKKFIEKPYPGVYLRILKEGKVQAGDTFELLEAGVEGLTIADVYQLLYQQPKDESKLALALATDLLPESCKASIRKRM